MGEVAAVQLMELMAQDTVVYCLTPLCEMGEVAAVN